MKFKSKSLISIILSIMMVISMILVAIPANAAVVDNEPVGAVGSAPYYLWYGLEGTIDGYDNPSNWVNKEMTLSGSSYSTTINITESYKNFRFIVNSDGQTVKNSMCWGSTDDVTNNVNYSNVSSKLDNGGFSALFYNVDGTDVYHSSLKFKSPINITITFNGTKGVTITEAGSAPTNYIIKSAETSNGSFSVSPTSAAEGNTVTVNTTPKPGYEVDTVTYTPDGGSATNATGSGNTYTFTMPAANVTVNVTFKESTTPTTNYYIGGRFKVKGSDNNEYLTYDDSLNNFAWNAACTDSNFKFIEDTTNTGWYYLNTNFTVADLSAQLSGKDKDGNTWSGDPYFLIHTGNGDGGEWYGAITNEAMFELQNTNALPASANLTSRKITNKEEQLIKFSAPTSTITGNVTLHFNPTELKLYYTTDGGTDTPNTLESGTTVYVRSSKEITSAKLSTTLNSEAQETDVAMAAAKIKDFNAKYYYSYTLTKDADNVTFTVTLKDETKAITKTAACAVGNNVYDVDKETWSAYEVDKANAYSSGLWVDVQPTVTNTTLALIKWSNQYGSSGTLSKIDGCDTYHLYIPSGVTLSTLPIYSKFSSLTINEETVENGKPYSSLTAGNTYTVVGDGKTYKLKVYQSDAASIYTSTPSGDLSTTTNNELLNKYKNEGYKPSFKDGSFMTVSENGSIKNTLTTLVEVKGRGNSSWESSCQHFGKYAYNIKLNSKIDPLGMGATKAKSFCMLANNMDEAQLRNLMTYQMGIDAKIPFTTHFKAVDWYNNGTYLGSYLITEKVDVGSSKLVKGKTVEDNHVYDADKAAKTQDTYVNSYGSITYQYVNTGDYTPGKKADGTTDTTDTYEKKSYLLEFDLEKRAKAENSWFKSPKGQYIAIKSYEDLNQNEMKFIIDKWCEAEKAVYDGDYNKANSLMDLDSFAQVYLVQELSKNLDSCATSYYVYYDGTQASPKWQATPLWDYDWAYGIYTKGNLKAIDKNGDKATQDLTSIDNWFVKYKYLTQNGEDAIDNNPYSFQAQLCTMPDFWKTNVKGVWNGGFYQSAVSAFGKYNSATNSTSDGKINNIYDHLKKSIAMNEARYGFVKDDPIESWGSLAKNEYPDDAYAYFKSWTAKRINWMATTGGLGTPVALTNVTLDAPTEVTVGNSITLKATVAPSTATGVKYTFYQGEKVLVSKSNSNTYTVTPSATGNYTYKVVATDGLTTATSGEISVTVKSLSITEVTLKSTKSSVKPGDTFTLTATAVPSDLSGVTYTFYQSTDPTVSIETDTRLESDGNKATVTADSTPGDYYYYVVAKDANNVEKPSSVITVKVTDEDVVIENVKIRFKGTTLSSLIPFMSVDGETAKVMTRSTAEDAIIGTHLSGAYRFVWFEATLSNVTVGKSKTLTFTTEKSKESTMNASITLDFNTLYDENVIYIAVDNLMSGTTAVDITNNETARTSFGSAMNMIKQSSASDPVATTLLSTMLKVTSASGQVTTKRYYLGDLDSDNTIGIKDATEIQKSIAGSPEPGAEYQSLGDFNADGVVDIKDATAIQKYIAGI